MSYQFVVGYDGSETAHRALDFAIERAQATGGSVVVAHVLEWSPYTFLTPSEIEERHARRKQELERAEEAVVAPILAELAAKNVPATSTIRYGHIADTLRDIAAELEAAQIIIGRNGHSSIGSRVFGSVAGSLVQTATVPCTIVP